MTGTERGEREREGIGRWGGGEERKRITGNGWRGKTKIAWVCTSREGGGEKRGRRGEERENEKMTASEREAGVYG